MGCIFYKMLDIVESERSQFSNLVEWNANTRHRLTRWINFICGRGDHDRHTGTVGLSRATVSCHL